MFRSCVQSYKIYTKPPTLGKPKYEDATPLAHRMATRSAAHAPTGLQILHRTRQRRKSPVPELNIFKCHHMFLNCLWHIFCWQNT